MIDKNKIETLKKLQEDMDSMKTTYNTKFDEFKEENKSLTDSIEVIRLSITEVKDELKVMGLKEFEVTGFKKLVGGLSIREMTNISYDDKEALNWALNHQLALKLDATKFKKFAKLQELDFVTFTPNPIVCFPAKLKVD